MARNELDAEGAAHADRVAVARLSLLEREPASTLKDLLTATLDLAEEITGSQIGFFHFVEEDQTTLWLQAWSTNTVARMCTAEGAGSHYPVSQAGVWADCVRTGKPVVHDDYASLPDRKGMPDGHAKVVRELTVPAIRAGRVCAVLGVGNKPGSYDEQDVKDVSALADLAWDIAARKRAEEALKASEQALRVQKARLDLAVASGRLGLWDLDMVSNKAWRTLRHDQLFGYEELQSDWGPEIALRHVVPADRPIFHRAFEEALATGRFHYVLRVETPSGQRRWLQADGEMFRDETGKPARMAGTIEDVTQRKLVEEALRATLAKLESHVDGSPLAVVEWGPDFRIQGWNPRAEAMFGWTRAEVIGKRIDDLPWVPDEEMPSVQEVSRAMATGTRPSNVTANRNMRKDGTIIHCEWHNSSLYDENGRLVSVLSMVQDVTSREQALAALRESQERLALFVEHAPAAIAMFDREMRYLGASRRWLSDYGLGTREIIGRSHYEIFPDMPERWKEVHRRCLAGAVERKDHDRFPRADGSTDWVNWEIRPWRDADGKVGGLIIFTEVVTGLVTLQSQLDLASRVAAMGTVVAGVAHEINNPLAAALSDLDLALPELRRVRDRLDEGAPVDRSTKVKLLDEVIEELTDARQAARRIERIVKELKIFGRPDPDRRRIRLADLVEKALQWLPASVGLASTLSVENQGAPDVLASAAQIQQVVLRLVENAAKAARPGQPGRIVVRLGPGAPGMARLEVSDEGTGIDPEVIDRIFDPFFTTSDVGKGLGLGLSVCHSIVQSHGGALSVTSELGKGSTFRMELPEAPAEE